MANQQTAPLQKDKSSHFRKFINKSLQEDKQKVNKHLKCELKSNFIALKSDCPDAFIYEKNLYSSVKLSLGILIFCFNNPVINLIFVMQKELKNVRF